MIFVSAGHHPGAPGASYNGFNEHDEALRWAAIILSCLGDRGVKVPAGVLREKVNFINSRDPVNCVAIEIHFNSAVDADGIHIGKGCESLYFPGSTKGAQLASVIQDALEPFFAPNRGAKEGWYRMNPSRGPDFFLERTACPAVIVEPEFIHNNEKIRANRHAACRALANALLAFVGE